MTDYPSHRIVNSVALQLLAPKLGSTPRHKEATLGEAFMPYTFGNIEDSSIPASRPNVIGETISSARRAAGYSLEQVAVTSGLTELEISKVEAGREGDQRVVTRIAKALGIARTACRHRLQHNAL
jgi:hypothetical protein